MERFRSPVVKLSVSVLILTIVSLAVIKLTSTPSPVAVSKPVLVAPDKSLLRNNIKSAFNSKDERGILAYLDLALEQKQPGQSYLYIKKTFEKMTASYYSAKAPEKKLAMTKLKTYISSLPDYKESDFIIPK